MPQALLTRVKKNLTENNVRTGQLPKYPKYTVTKYLEKRASNVTHRYVIINIIKK